MLKLISSYPNIAQTLIHFKTINNKFNYIIYAIKYIHIGSNFPYIAQTLIHFNKINNKFKVILFIPSIIHKLVVTFLISYKLLFILTKFIIKTSSYFLCHQIY